MAFDFENFENAEYAEDLDAIEYAQRRRSKMVPFRTKRARRAIPVQARASQPTFTTQFDLNFSFAQGGAGAATATKFPVVVFGNSDMQGNFAGTLGQCPILDPAFVFSGFYIAPSAQLFTITGSTNPGGAINGDGVFVYQRPVDGHWIVIVVNCNQVAYGSLLGATQSDRFVINTIRYSVPNPAVLTQFLEKIGYFYQSTFGKATKDSLNPNSYKTEANQTQNIVTIPMSWGVDKYGSLYTYIIPTAGVQATWSVFVNYEQLLKA